MLESHKDLNNSENAAQPVDNKLKLEQRKVGNIEEDCNIVAAFAFVVAAVDIA